MFDKILQLKIKKGQNFKNKKFDKVKKILKLNVIKFNNKKRLKLLKKKLKRSMIR